MIFSYHKTARAFVVCLLALAGLNSCRGTDGDFVVAENGKARAVVITADDPTPVALLAAKELTTHVEKSTGVKLRVITESEAPESDGVNRIFIGASEAVKSGGLNTDTLSPDAFVMRQRGNDLFIAGKENRENYDSNGLNGTLFGVYEFLHRYVGVRWLWPGELGTYVPQASRIAVLDKPDDLEPVEFSFRRFRTGSLLDRPMEGLSYSGAVYQKYRKDEDVFLRRHRLGEGDEKPAVGHYFAGWWEKYGEEHPGWFAMQDDGQRGYVPGRNSKTHVGMCVSNPELHRFIVEEAWDGGDILRLGEVDRRNFCQCENCRAWDVPPSKKYPASVRFDYLPQVVSDRYARFWKTIRNMAKERNPDVTVTTFLYWNNFPAPQGDIELGKYVYGEFVPWTGDAAWYPMPGKTDRWVREQWLGWEEKGIRLAYRPNMFHGGYVMPWFSSRQAGSFFKFAWEHGMEGFDFDRLYGYWSTRGLMLYVYMRLAWEPGAEIEQLRQEYFSAFGPAAVHVERYFDFFEAHAHELAEKAGTRAAQIPDSVFSRHTRFAPDFFPPHPLLAGNAYPPEVLAKGQAMLDTALNAVKNHSRDAFRRRVEFLQAGLEHARLSVRFLNTLEGGIPDEVSGYIKAKKALQELVDFRRSHEQMYFADLEDAAWREAGIEGLQELLGKLE